MSSEIRQAAIFVAFLSASNHIYSEATWRPELAGHGFVSHVRIFESLGGCTALFVPNNLKSGATSACYYEPELNPPYRPRPGHPLRHDSPSRPPDPVARKTKPRLVNSPSGAGHDAPAQTAFLQPH